jgi:hypothetical protein
MADNMKKEINYIQEEEEEDIQSVLMEEPHVYLTTSIDFAMKDFESLNYLLGFSQFEWADILHFSPRTLQRYLKDGNGFEGLQAELLHHIKRLTQAGLMQFSTKESFVQWLRIEKDVLGHRLDFNALKSITGVRMLREELGRMAEGVYI